METLPKIQPAQHYRTLCAERALRRKYHGNAKFFSTIKDLAIAITLQSTEEDIPDEFLYVGRVHLKSSLASWGFEDPKNIEFHADVVRYFSELGFRCSINAIQEHGEPMVDCVVAW